MKLLVIFVHDRDAPRAAEALVRENFRFTLLNSTSGLLREATQTFLIGTEEERVESCLQIFRQHCDARRVGAPGSILEGVPIREGEFTDVRTPITVEVGGAVAFAVDTERLL